VKEEQHIFGMIQRRIVMVGYVNARKGTDIQNVIILVIKIINICIHELNKRIGAGVAQSVQYLITDWKTRVRSPAEAKDCSCSLRI
jgi:hypothetical protein